MDESRDLLQELREMNKAMLEKYPNIEPFTKEEHLEEMEYALKEIENPNSEYDLFGLVCAYRMEYEAYLDLRNQ